MPAKTRSEELHDLPEIVGRAILHTVVDIGQLTKRELRELNTAVRKGWLDKGKGGPFPKIKTVYARKGYPFNTARIIYVSQMLGEIPWD